LFFSSDIIVLMKKKNQLRLRTRTRRLWDKRASDSHAWPPLIFSISRRYRHGSNNKKYWKVSLFRLDDGYKEHWLTTWLALLFKI
jgi:hypothetical protein